jgi:hypothetical protein
MGFLNRLWTGIVAAVAAVACALVVQIVGIMLIGLPVEFLGWIVLVFGTIGFLIGVVVGNRKSSSSTTSPKKNKSVEQHIWLE